jgi:hypothetical protein
MQFVIALLTGSVAGALLTSLATASRERQRWVLDNKKAEWRELIDRMNYSLTRMERAFTSTFDPEQTGIEWKPRTGIEAGEVVIRNRIFIAETLEKNGVHADWSELREQTWTAIRNHWHDLETTEHFMNTREEFEAKLAKLAREDVRADTSRLGILLRSIEEDNQ